MSKIDFDNCSHNFIRILSQGVGGDSERVAKWCSNCGAIKIDLEENNMTYDEYCMKIKYPQITRSYILKEI